MIDIANEELLSLAEAAKRLPPRRNGKRPASSTLFRWARDGVDGIHLSVLVVGNTTCTSMQSLQRFFEQLTEASLPGNQQKPPTSERLQEVNKALDGLGV